MAKEVAANVQKSSSEIVQSVAVTDWGKEIRDFGSALQQDTQDMADEAKETIATTQSENLERLAKLPKSKEEVQESMEVLGNTLETFGKNIIGGTSELISQVTETVQQELQAASIKHKQTQQEMRKAKQGPRGGAAGAAEAEEEARRKRFEAKVSAMQRDSGTYCDEPEDLDYFEMWQTHFSLGDHGEQVEATLEGNAFLSELQSRIVPLIVDYETFWRQYFFRLHLIEVEEGLAERFSAAKVDGDGDDGGEKEEEESAAASEGEVGSAAAAAVVEDGLREEEGGKDQPTPPPAEEQERSSRPAISERPAAAADVAMASPQADASPSPSPSVSPVSPRVEEGQSPPFGGEGPDEAEEGEEVPLEGEEEEGAFSEFEELPSPAVGVADDFDEDDIDEDWGEM